MRHLKILLLVLLMFCVKASHFVDKITYLRSKINVLYIAPSPFSLHPVFWDIFEPIALQSLKDITANILNLPAAHMT